MVQAAVARNLRRVSIGCLDSFLYCWPRASAFFGEVKNMTSDNSIRDVPCPSDLKRNENVFIIGAASRPRSFRGIMVSARFIGSPVKVNDENIVSFYFRRHLLRLDNEAVFRIDKQHPRKGCGLCAISRCGRCRTPASRMSSLTPSAFRQDMFGGGARNFIARFPERLDVSERASRGGQSPDSGTSPATSLGGGDSLKGASLNKSGTLKAVS
jgi:hypothetical protein